MWARSDDVKFGFEPYEAYISINCRRKYDTTRLLDEIVLNVDEHTLSVHASVLTLGLVEFRYNFFLFQ